MSSDSESQDSDEGRRFRFETTRKDTPPASRSKRKASPERNKRLKRQSLSRDTSPQDEKIRYTKDDLSYRNRLPSDRDTSNRHSIKDRSLKDSRHRDNRDLNLKKQHDKDSRSHHSKDSRSYESRESKGRDYGIKHKKKSREKHKKHNRDRSRDRSRDRNRDSNNLTSEEFSNKEKREEMEPSSTLMETEKIKIEKPKLIKEQQEFVNEKLNKNIVEPSESKSTSSVYASSNPLIQRFATANTDYKAKKSFFNKVVNKGIDNDTCSMYGPALPPELEKKMFIAKEAIAEAIKEENEKLLLDSDNDGNEIIGPALPTSLTSPVNVQVDKNEENLTDETIAEKETIHEECEEDLYGPAMPPHMTRREIVGPTLPENFVAPSDTNTVIEDTIASNDDDDDDIVGPLPADHPAMRDNHVQMQLEHRARLMQKKLRDKTSPEKNKREEWMVELPPAHAVALGLGSIPRKFKTSEGPDMSDRSIWTDTPADRLRKQREKEENRFIASEESKKKTKKSTDNEPMEEPIEERPQESLLDMHLKSMKRKKKKLEKEAKELGLPTRRPFDRDIDLQINRLDDAKKKKIFDKASRLNDRFTSGRI